MFELNGKYNSCKVFTDMTDNETISQLTTLLNQKFTEDSQIRIMSDCHAGAGCVIGTTMTLHDKVVANLVGVDIGCFTGDTPVWCSAGHYTSIKELAETNQTFMTDCFDEEQKAFVKDRALAHLTRRNAELVAVTYTANNKDIRVRCTPDHQYLICKQNEKQMTNYKDKSCYWVEAQYLQPGYQLVAEDNYVTVKSVEPLEEREDVYCLTVENVHNFAIQGGVIVHNCGMLTVKLKEKESDIDMMQLDKAIRKYVPAGFNVHSSPKHKTPLDCEKLACWKKKNANINDLLAYRSVGTLGGGEVLASGRINSPA